MQRTLAFTILLMASFGLSAKAQLIDIQFGGNDYYPFTAAYAQTDVGIIGSVGDKWNDFTSDSALEAGVSLNNSAGTASGATLTVSGGNYASYPNGTIYQKSDVQDGNAGADTLSGTTVYNLASGELGASDFLTLSFIHLAANTTYSIDLLSSPEDWSRKSAWSVNGGTAQDVGPLNAYTGPYQSSPYGASAPTALVLGTNYLVLSGTTDGLGNLTISGTSLSGDININGLQLEATSAPEPSTYAMIMVGGLVTLVVIRRKRSMLV